MGERDQRWFVLWRERETETPDRYQGERERANVNVLPKFQV